MAEKVLSVNIIWRQYRRKLSAICGWLVKKTAVTSKYQQMAAAAK
jgi:hypothetical protein